MKNLMCINKYTEEVFSITSDDVLTSGLQTAQTAKRVVSIELLESGVSDIIGFVNTIEDGYTGYRRRTWRSSRAEPR